MNPASHSVQLLADIADQEVRDAIASTLLELGFKDSHLATAEITFCDTGYDEAGDESGAAPWQGRHWQSIEVRVGRFVLAGGVAHVHCADGACDSWVDVRLVPWLRFDV